MSPQPCELFRHLNIFPKGTIASKTFERMMNQHWTINRSSYAIWWSSYKHNVFRFPTVSGSAWTPWREPGWDGAFERWETQNQHNTTQGRKHKINTRWETQKQPKVRNTTQFKVRNTKSTQHNLLKVRITKLSNSVPIVLVQYDSLVD